MVTFIIQSRMGSTRLPGKLLLPFYGRKTILDILLDKLRRIERADVIIATTDNPTDDPIADKARQLGVKCYRGTIYRCCEVLWSGKDCACLFGQSLH